MSRITHALVEPKGGQVMTIETICDGCGKRETVKEWRKPYVWFERQDHDGVQLACSRQCIEVVAKTTGKTKTVLPL